MLVSAAVLLLLVSAMHSVLGGRRLIQPLLAREDFPIILGSIERSRFTLWAGWHLLSITWVALAGVMVAMHLVPAQRSVFFIVACSVLFGGSGLLALFLSRGRHLSWLFFLPASAMLAIEALS